MADNSGGGLPQQLAKLATGLPPAPPEGAAEDLRGPYVLARHAAQNDHYIGLYQQWAQTILFLLGQHWLNWDAKARRYGPAKDIPPWRQMPKTEIVYAVARTVTAKFTKQKPVFECVPPTGDSDDRASARLAQALLTWAWVEFGVARMQRRAVTWYLCTGQLYWRVSWDAEAGEYHKLTQLVEVPNPDHDPEDPDSDETMDADCPCDADGKPLLSADGSYDLKGKPHQLPEGSIAYTIEDPLCVRWNPEATSGDDAIEQFVAKFWPKEKAKKQFKLSDKDLESSASDSSEREFFQNLMSSAASGGWQSQNALQGRVGMSQEEALGQQVLVIEYFAKESPEYPEGRYWITIGKKKVWPRDGDTKYPNGEDVLPEGLWPALIPCISTPIPGQPHGIAPLAKIVPQNQALNSLDGAIKENELTMSRGGKWVKHPADKKMAQITSDPAQVLESAGYALGKPPMQIELKGLPAEVYNERNVIMEKVRLTLALSQIEAGQPPEGVTAGRAFLVLQEVTDSVWGPDLAEFGRLWEEVGRRTLVIAQRHMKRDKIIRIRGERGKWEFPVFNGANLRDGIDVRVQEGSMAPWSQAAQADFKLSALTSFPGLITKPDGTTDRAAFSHFMDPGDSGLASFESDEDPDEVEIDREHAEFESYSGKEGQPVPHVAFWQDHPAHLAGHYRFMKRDFGRFKKWAPLAQQLFMEHMQLTEQAVQQMAGNIVAAAGAGGGADMNASDAQESGEGTPMQSADGSQPMNANESPQLSSADMNSAQ